MRRIAVVTGARSDYGIYLPILRRIRASPGLSLLLIAGGTHLAERYGRTIDAIVADGFEVAARVDMAPQADGDLAVAESMARGVSGFARAYAELAPDVAVVLGDRFEMLSAAVAALPLRIPLAHIHGGELTEGALDDAIRHAMTKLSHLHFVSTEEYARRVIAMGEEPWRVAVSGAPALDNLHDVSLMTREELDRAFGLALDRPFLLLTYHPVTLEPEQTAEGVASVLRAAEKTNMPMVVTYPNADMGSRIIIERLQACAARNPRVRLVTSLGTRAYFSMLAHAAVMLGNSSSGIVEAASFRLAVVNVGDRQQGRVRGANVIDCGPDEQSIEAALARALSPAFRETLHGLRNPYGDGHASDRIVRTLASVPLDKRLLRKKFHEPAVTAAARE